MKRLSTIMMCLFAMMAVSMNARAQEITINLRPGWNWIGYPNAMSMEINDAFGDFMPMEGDVVKSEFAFAEYLNGNWAGSLTHFMPGKGYMYCSRRTEETSFVFRSSTPQIQVLVTTSEPLLITAISAMGGGEVTTNDGTYIITKGLCWATHENPMTNDDFYQEAESGVGSFSISMTELNIATTYYVRAYAVTPNGTVYGDQKSFTTRDGIPILTTTDITDITAISVTSGGDITDNGGLNVTARGVCWSTSPNPTVSDSHTTDGTGTGSFTSSITGLEVSTTYYVRAYATTNVCTSYGNEVSFTTPSGIPEVVTNPVTDVYGDGATMGCTVVDDGGFVVDQENGWCRIGVCWSTSPNPTTQNHSAFIDNYDESEWSYGSISNDFNAYRTGLTPSTTYYVRAYAKTRFGTSYGNEVSFTTPAPLWSNGVLPGEFSVSEGQQVRFSQGNLQYKASTDTWRFALNQWAFVGGAQIIGDDYGEYITEVNGNVYTESGAKCDNANVSSTYSGWIDLFGWGTSGHNHGASCYQPWNTSEIVSDYYAYGNSSYNLYDQTRQADWGSNAISNGGSQSNLWRTLTSDEWTYLFNSRSTPSGIRYAKAIVFDTKGVILLPDDWDPSCYPLNNTNKSGASFSSNTITTEQWNILEQHGAVFLCETGRRHRYTYWESGCCDEPGGEVEIYGFYAGEAYYWSSSCKNTSNAWLFSIKASGVNTQNYALRHKGMAVRLVCSSSQCSPTVTTAEVNNITHCQATCGGIMTDDGGCDATARGVCWSTTPNPTVADAHTVDGNGIGNFTSTLTGLMPSTTYYVRAYATNLFFTEYGSEVSFTTSVLPDFCTISLSANQTEGGIVNGGGTYAYGQSCSVHAMPNIGFYFVNWTENGSVVSTSATYTFTVTDNKNLVANFTAYPIGAVNGQFSVSETQQVLFSQGNLQYQASTNTWKFADNQYDYVGSANSNISSSYNGWIDLFGWGTSGYNHGANCYWPWSTSQTNSDYYAYGSFTYNLYDSSGKADWGYNPISNGGNTSNQWRTLTKSEWSYIFNTRTTVSGIRYAKAQVNEVNGVIILPDDWSASVYALNDVNGGNYNSNTLSATQWTTFESAGAVFLPAAGYRYWGTSIYSVGSGGSYWSSSYDSGNYVYRVNFNNSELIPDYWWSERSTGYSVRLVRDSE